MDIYGKLNNETIKKEYASIETDTAKVTINNDSDTIKVDVKKVPGKLIIDEYGKSEIDKTFDGSKDITIKLPTEDSIIALDNKIDQETKRATDKENELDTKIENEATTREYEDGILENNITILRNDLNDLDNKVTNLKTSEIQNDGDGTSPFATEEWVSENAGKIDSISVNGKPQVIENKNVNLQVLETSGGTITGDLSVNGNLNVTGTTVTKDTESLLVKDNIIVTNAEKATLQQLSGLAINKNSTDTYGIMYDPNEDSVKLGLGKLDDKNEFTFNEAEGSPVATRADNSTFTNNHLIKWNSEGNKLVDSGKSIEDISGGLTVLTNLDFPLSADLLAKVKANPQNYCIRVNNNIYKVGVVFRTYAQYFTELQRTNNGIIIRMCEINLNNGYLAAAARTLEGILEDGETTKYELGAGKLSTIGINAVTNNQTLTGDDLYLATTIDIGDEA